MTPSSPFHIANFRYYWAARLLSMLAASSMMLIIGWQAYNIARETMGPSATSPAPRSRCRRPAPACSPG
jgi:hypothetical protein